MLKDHLRKKDRSIAIHPDTSAWAAPSLGIEKRPEDQLPIRILHAVNTLFTRVYHNLTILSPCHLPRQGPAIIVSNHISGLDPLLIQSACPTRLITWMMAKEYMALPGMGPIFRVLGVIPVDRGSRETGPLRQAIRQLDRGRVLGIFPEGKISTTGDLLDFQTGVALLALRSGAPVFPVYLDGTQRNKEMGPAFLYRNRSAIALGPPLLFHHGAANDLSKTSMDAATATIKMAILRLRIEVDKHRNVQ